jgi:hypothetical protein
MTGQPTRKPIAIDQAVVAVGHHRSGNTQEGRGGHVVAGDRQAVLEAGDATAGGVEVSSRLGLGGGPLGDEHRAGNENAEHGDGGPVGGLLFSLAEIGAGARATPEASMASRPRKSLEVRITWWPP